MTNNALTESAERGTEQVRVRFAPSPTGSLHIGGGRTALFTWLHAHGEARRAGKTGAFILRIEDTDRNRFVPGATESIQEILTWFGLNWDEGPGKDGPYGPYVQSERTELYRAHAQQLIDSGHAYRCFCTPERLEQVRQAQRARNEAPGYDRHCRNLTHEQIETALAANQPYVVRFAMPLDGETKFTDLIRGEITYQNVNLEDLVLLKSDGYPTYHLANVVDDHSMHITLITRGPEWIPSAPLHIRLYEAFGWTPPQLAHMPLILAPGGGKLSKRHGATAMEEFRDRGYLPEALMNYLVLLGWSYDATTEIFSLDDLLAKFQLERVSPSPATFDLNKLNWFNQHYINHILTVDDLTQRVLPFLADAQLVESATVGDTAHPQYNLVKEATALLKDRIVLLSEAPDLMSYFLIDELPDYDALLLVPKKTPADQALRALTAAQSTLATIDIENEENTEHALRQLAEQMNLKPGQLFMPIRVAVTGRTQSPGLFGTMRVIGNQRCRHRIEKAIELLTALVASTAGADEH